MKYYITKAGEDGEMVEMKMEKPECWQWRGPDPMECPKCIKYRNHLASLPRVKHRLPNKVGDIVEEGKDFEWEEWCSEYELCDCAPNTKCQNWVKVAVPKVDVDKICGESLRKLADKPKEESFTREDMIGFAEWVDSTPFVFTKELGWVYPITNDTYTSTELLTKYLTNKKQ